MLNPTAKTKAPGEPAEKRKSGRFQKGQSGNPGGRPKDLGHVRELARSYAAEALETLVKIMRDKRASTTGRAGAAVAVLDRGYGKSAPPPQRRLGGPGSYDFSRLTPDQVRQGYEIAKLMAPDSVGDTD